VQDVTGGSPAERAGIRAYDVVLSFDGVTVGNDDDLIRQISGKAPGTSAPVRLLRDGREVIVTVKLSERPRRDTANASAQPTRNQPIRDSDDEAPLGLTVRDLDAAAFNRLELPRQTRGVLITRVEPLSPSFDADVQRGTVLLQIN